jgi:PAS domain S-box-containing protein
MPVKRRRARQPRPGLPGLRAELAKLAADVRRLSPGPNPPSQVLHRLLDASPLAALVVDDAGAYVFANRAAAELTGYSAAELHRLSFWQLTPNVEEREAEVLWRTFIDTGQQSGEYRVLSKGGPVILTVYAAKANFLPGLHLSLLRRRSARRPAK